MDINHLKGMLSIEEAAKLVGITVADFQDLIANGDIHAYGSQKRLIKSSEMLEFLGLDKECKSMSSSKEPFWDKAHQAFAIALSLGYDENGKRLRKVIRDKTYPGLLEKYTNFCVDSDIVPDEEIIKSLTSDEVTPPPKAMKPTNTKASNITVEQYVLDAMGIWKGSVSDKTYMTYVWAARHVISELGALKMCELNQDIVERYINSLPARTYQKNNSEKLNYYSQSSINKIYDFLHKVVQRASRNTSNKMLESDIMLEIRKPRTHRLGKDTDAYPFTDEELASIDKALIDDLMIYTWMNILSYTGMRPSEPLALQFTDINYVDNTIKVKRTLGETFDFDSKTHKPCGAAKPIIKELKNVKTNGKVNFQIRSIKCSDRLMSIIKAWETKVKSNEALMLAKKAHGTENYMFCGSDGQFWLYRDYKQRYERALDKAGLDSAPMNPYRFRHTCCTRLLREGIDVPTVQRYLGDNTPDMVLKVYANMNQNDVHRAGETHSANLDKVYGEA